MKKFFYLLFSTIILISCGNGAKAKTEAQSTEESCLTILRYFISMERSVVSPVGQ